MRCLFDKSEMEEIEERIKKGHAIILWGKDLDVMTRLLQNPESEKHESWPQEINLGIDEFVLARPRSGKRISLPGHWQPSRLLDGRKTFMKVTTPELGIRLHDKYFATPRTWTGARSTLWTKIYPCEAHEQKKCMAQFVHQGSNEEFASPASQVDCSIGYINVHESSNIVKRVENPVVYVDDLTFIKSYLNFEVEGLDTASPTLEDTVEMRRAWSEGKEAYLQIDW